MGDRFGEYTAEELRQAQRLAEHRCYRCPRPLQLTSIAEATGLCDRCRSIDAIERTSLANVEYRAKTGELLKEPRPSFRARMARLLAEDPEGCECQVCVRNWEEHG